MTPPPGYGPPPGFGPYQDPGGEPILLTIGDISITQTHVIVPAGRFPLRGTTWSVEDYSLVSEGIPTVAIVLTIIFVWFCLLGLLFLLMKEKKYSGFVSVSVTGEGFFHTAQFPAGPQTSMWAANMVNQARGLAVSAPPPISD